MFYLVMGNERIEVDSVILSRNESITGYSSEGEKIIRLEGVNFQNVYLEDAEGQKIDFPVEQTTKEIEEMKNTIKELNEKVQQLEEKEKVVEHDQSVI
ncbi:hypothetical protein [Bacillus altitudinis]|uniref:hypothetical protein n=1 Tax=Bacillus altitudinis TaxID=293387 RepID=UPI002020D52A|nr:hypothetical protein [Bacillus altitudinis]MCL7873533.1 hypothetical protein [Bacillus altitudinis]WOQ72326.1 hypothetical protein R0126_17290 [Bacillus stratosphericus]